MITSLFKNSKPLNFILVVFCIIFLSGIVVYKQNIELSLSFVLAVFVLCFNLFLLNFIASKNNLNTNDAFVALSSLFFLGLVIDTVVIPKYVFANVFVLFGIRRVINLKNQESFKRKIFDASLFFAIASIFTFWTILFYAVIYGALLYFSKLNLKNALVPLLAFASVYMIHSCYNIIFFDLFLFPNVSDYNLDFSDFFNAKNITKTIIFGFLVFSLFIIYSKKIVNSVNDFKYVFRVLATIIIVAVFVVILIPSQKAEGLIFITSPLILLFSNFIKDIRKFWIKETLAVLLLLAVVLNLVL